MARLWRKLLNGQSMARLGMGNISEGKRKEIRDWTKENQGRIPNLDRLCKKLVDNAPDGHYFHAHCVRRLDECGRYKITDIEVTTAKHDVDIQLDGRINIQAHLGMNTGGHVMDASLHPGTPKSESITKRLGSPTEQGGVPTNFDHDEKKIFRKLDQLPDDALGILLVHGDPIPYFVPIPPAELPANKCIISTYNVICAQLHCSPAFQHREDADGVAYCFGRFLFTMG